SSPYGRPAARSPAPSANTPPGRSAPRARSRVNHGLRKIPGHSDPSGATKRGLLSRGFARMARSYRHACRWTVGGLPDQVVGNLEPRVGIRVILSGRARVDLERNGGS